MTARAGLVLRAALRAATLRAMLRALRRAAFGGVLAVALVGVMPACLAPPHVVRPPLRYGVRLVGASDVPLREWSRRGRSVFVGRPGRDYAIELTNGTDADLGVTLAVDGVDPTTGDVVRSCSPDEGGYLIAAKSRGVVRGFSSWGSKERSFRLSADVVAPSAPRAAPVTGTIEACFFTVARGARAGEPPKLAVLRARVVVDYEGEDGQPLRTQAGPR